MGRASVIPRTAQNQNRGKVEKLNPIPPGLFESGAAWGGGGMPAAYNSKTINDSEMKLGGVVKDH